MIMQQQILLNLMNFLFCAGREKLIIKGCFIFSENHSLSPKNELGLAVLNGCEWNILSTRHDRLNSNGILDM